MRQETIVKKWYKFDELSERGQAKAISDNYTWNVDMDWWVFTYEDMKTVGLRCHGFDIDRGSYCKLEFMWSADQTADKILTEHGETCDTYKLAMEFKADVEKLDENYNGYSDLVDQFKKDLQTEYLSILRNEFEYLTSAECIKESIIANEVEFDGDKYEAKTS